MITARMSGWGTKWQVTSEAAPLTTLGFSGWRVEPRFELGGHTYRVVSSGIGSCSTLRDGDDVVATAEGLGHKEWRLQHEGRTHLVRRVSVWRGDQDVVDPDGATVGHIRRNAWYTEVEGEIPTLPDAVVVFALAVLVTSWTQLSVVTAAVSG